MAGRRIPSLLASAALAALAAAPGPAPAAPILDLSELSALVEEGAAAGGTSAAAKAYGRLARLMAKESRRGLPDDIAKAGAVAKACEGPLVGDGELGAAAGGALDAAASILRALDAEVIGLAGELAVERHRVSVLAAASRARSSERQGEVERALGNDARAAGRLRRAALGFLRAGAAADRLLAREVPKSPVWAVPVQGRGGALLGIWGEPGTDPRLYAVGAADASGPQFLVLHPGAEGWVRVPVAASGDLWWVAGVPGDGVWACGSGGRVVRYDPATGTLEDRSTGADAVLYGVWGSGPSDVWAVGGAPTGAGPRPALLRWDGSGWTAAEPPASAAGSLLYKVWGAAPDDVWAVGEGGTVLHFDGASWSGVDAGTASTLLTVHGPSPVTAVGGGASAVVVERDAAGAWSSVPVAGVASGSGSQFPGPVQTLNGVFVPATGAALAVGMAGSVVRRDAAGWRGVPGAPAGVRDLHAVWMDEAGNAVMVGGRLSTLTEGQVVTLGRRRLPSDVATQARFRSGLSDLLYGSCAHSGCHLPPFSSAGLAVDTPEVILANLVSVPSTQSPLLRVSPGRPSGSYLWHKLLGTQESVGGEGGRMPGLHDSTTAWFTEEQLDLVRGWILDGARDD